MKKVYFKTLCAVVVALAAIISTSCEKPTEEVILPETQTIVCKAGDTPKLSFNATADWQLSSNATWCKFITAAGTMLNTAGGAGSHTITLKITNDNLTDEVSKANITMKMGGKEAVIATVERAAKELTVAIYDANGAKSNVIKIGYGDYIATTIEANFHFAAEIPEWVEVAQVNDEGYVEVTNSISGYAGDKVEALLRIVNDGQREKSPITTEDGFVITFFDESQNNSFEFPIVYDGMGGNNLSFVGPTSNTFGWTVSLDGKSFSQYNEADGTTTTFSDELLYTITAQNDDYEILFFEQHIERGISSYEHLSESSSWMSFDKSRMALRVGEHSGLARYGVVIALPRDTYNGVKSNVDALFEMDLSSGVELPTIKNDYLKYVLIDLVQQDVVEEGEYEGMYAYHSLTTLEIPCFKLDDQALAELYGTEEIYTCDFVNSVANKRPGLIVDPRIEEWTTANYDTAVASAEVWLGETKLKMSEGEYYIGENKDEVLGIHLWGPNNGWNGENMVVIFKVDGITEKVLIVTPPAK